MSHRPGILEPVTLVATPPDVLFEQRVIVEPNGCWRWTGVMNGRYPQMQWREDRRKMRQPARTWAWERRHGRVPTGMLVVATCGNGLCVNPEHATVRSVAEHRETPMPRRIERFWSRVDRSAGPDGCWPWTGMVIPTTGYGHASWGRENIAAHQVAFLIANGWRPKGRSLYVCHHCDNPVCCNPAHLYAGTPAQNCADRERRGRSRPTRGHTSPLAKLTEEQVREIRRRHAAGGTSYPKLAAEFGVHPPEHRSDRAPRGLRQRHLSGAHLVPIRHQRVPIRPATVSTYDRR